MRSRSQPTIASSSGVAGNCMSRTSSVSWRFVCTDAKCARNASPTFPFTSST
ncbi:Uncharacterised protein [Mycobacteroides abscessus subsp. abscessus]|nr:Uncharacterised protein [Mycobacteroides abscessus subsp. abscessus]